MSELRHAATSGPGDGQGLGPVTATLRVVSQGVLVDLDLGPYLPEVRGVLEPACARGCLCWGGSGGDRFGRGLYVGMHLWWSRCCFNLGLFFGSD